MLTHVVLFFILMCHAGVTNRRTDEDDIDVDRHTDVLINKTMTQNNITERQEVSSCGTWWKFQLLLSFT